MQENSSVFNTSRVIIELPTSLKLDLERIINEETKARNQKIYLYHKMIELITTYTYCNKTGSKNTDQLLDFTKQQVLSDISVFLSKKQGGQIKAVESENIIKFEVVG